MSIHAERVLCFCLTNVSGCTAIKSDIKTRSLKVCIRCWGKSRLEPKAKKDEMEAEAVAAEAEAPVEEEAVPGKKKRKGRVGWRCVAGFIILNCVDGCLCVFLSKILFAVLILIARCASFFIFSLGEWRGVWYVLAYLAFDEACFPVKR